MLEVPQHLIDLIHVALGVMVLYAQLIAVGLADGAVLVRPRVPDAGAQIVHVVAFGLPYPQQFVNSGLPVCAPYGEYRKFAGQIVAVYNAKFLDRVGACAVLPVRADFAVGVPDAVIKNVPAVLDEYLVCSAHIAPP